MATKDRTQIVQTLLEASDRAFEAGNNKLGSLKLWEAAECALSIVADGRGWPCQTVEDHFYILEQLKAENGKGDDIDLLGSTYQTAGYFRNNADHDFMEDYVVKGGRPLVHQFVDGLLDIARQSSK